MFSSYFNEGVALKLPPLHGVSSREAGAANAAGHPASKRSLREGKALLCFLTCAFGKNDIVVFRINMGWSAMPLS